MNESEYKYMLTIEQYDKILNHLKSKYKMNTIIQVNYYLDTNTFELDEKDITLRIRQKKDSLRLDLKSPVLRDGALRVKNEFTRSISELPLTIKFENDEWNDFISCKSDMYLKGMLITERTIFIFNEGIEIDLDLNYYLGVMDYELEVEFQEEFQADAVELINSLARHGELKPSEFGKRSRFFKKLKEKMSI